MGWSIGYDSNWKRDIGYGVPAVCDHPGCDAEINRGLGYVCGGEPYGGEYGCGLYFCSDHLFVPMADREDCNQLCERCMPDGGDPFEAKPDTDEWTHHKETHESWAKWRAERDNNSKASEG